MVNDKILYDLDDNFGHWWECGFSAPTMTKNLYPYTKMFSPIKVNKLTIKNRLVYQGDLGVIRIMMSVMMLLYCLHTVVIVPLLAVRYLSL